MLAVMLCGGHADRLLGPGHDSAHAHTRALLCPQVPKTGKGLSPVELARVKRSGKGHHGFKSKARHKRR